jgi:exopolysaccharide biosynthesis polyprenyl glycosylphosphotransferase
MVGVAVTATVMRTRWAWFAPELAPETFSIATPLMLAGWLALIAALGGYRERLFGSGVEEYRVVLNSTLWAAGLTGVGCYIVSFELSRSFYALVFILGGLCLVAGRYLLRRALHRARRANTLTHDVVIAGSLAHIESISRVLRAETWLGYRILGAVVPPGAFIEETTGGTPVLGSTDQLVDVLTAVNADVVVVAGGALDGAEQMRALVWDLEALEIRVVVAPSVSDVSRQRVHVRPVGGLPLLHIDPPRHVRARRRAKRVFDVVFTCALLVAVAPVLLLIALSVKLHDQGPVLFRQTRTGRDGLEFPCLKFRTMVVDAEDRLRALLAACPAASEEYGRYHKLRNDPRITRLGRILRATSIDEIPQLWNVIVGDMSLVGPRPYLPREQAAMAPADRTILLATPGITGLWQVTGRNRKSFEDRIRIDIEYVRNWSLWVDLYVLAKTIPALLDRKSTS